jgi:hypothetical protein
MREVAAAVQGAFGL